MNPRAERASRFFEVPVLLAALLVVPVVLVEEQASSPAWLAAAEAANWLIWGAFLLELTVLLSLVDDRRAYLRRAWLDVVIVVVSFPLLPELLASTRLARLARLARVLRLLRLIQLAAILTRGGHAVRVVFKKRGVGYLTILTLLVAFAFGGLFMVLEPGHRFGDGLWWAMVTLTTVGYGDVYPETTAGRAVGIVLMIFGIGLMAVLTGAIAAHFVEEEEEDLAGEVRRLHERLDRIEALLRER